MSNLIDVTENELITADRQNLINQYIEHGTHRINTLSLNIGGTETISSGRIGDFLGLSIGNFNGILKATNGTVSVATLNTDYIKDLSIFTTDNLTEGLTNFYDKIVSLTAGVGISVSGTYPNFTITNTGEANSFIAGNGIDIVESPDDTFTFSVDESDLSLSNFGEKSHTSLTDIGSNSHAQIDSHISDSSIHFSDLSGFTTDDLTDTADNRFTNDTDIARLANTSGTNTGDVSVLDSSEIDFTLTGQQITASIKSGSIDKTKLDTSVNSSLDLADTSIQTELDPVFSNSEAANITATDITNLSNLSGTNTGDQDLSGLLPNSHLTDFTHSDIAHTNRSSLDLVSGTNTGDQVLPTRDSLGLDTDDTVTFANLSGTNTGDQTLPVNSDFNLSDLGDVDDTDKAEGKILKVNSAGTHIYVNDESGTDEKVKYDVNDPTAGYLADKFIAGDGISLTEGTSADENKLVITNSDKGSDVDLSGLVPYSGATTNVDLGSNDLYTTGDITAGTFNSETLAVNTNNFVVNSDGKVGIGTKSPISMLNINQEAKSLRGLTITGYGYASTSPYSATDGIAIYMNYNGINNRQTVIGSTDAIGSSSLGVFRFLTGSTGYASLDAVSGDGTNRLLTIMGTDTTNVGVGYAESNGTGADFTGRLSVFTSTKSGSRTNLLIKKFGTASGNYIDVKNSANTSLFKIDSTGRVGIGTVTPQQALDVTGRGYLRQATSSSPLAWDFVKSNGATMTTFFVAGASNQFLNGSVAGDSGFRAMGGKFLIGAGPTVDIEPAIAMTVETDGEIRFPNDYVAGGAGSLLFGAGGDAGMGYNGTNFVINPKVVGSGYLNIQGQTLLDDKLMFTQTDGNEYIDSLADGYLDLGATTGIRLKQDTTLDEDKDLNLSGTGFVDSPKYKAGGTEPVTDGTYTVGIGGTQNGTITIKGGIITAVQEAVA